MNKHQVRLMRALFEVLMASLAVYRNVQKKKGIKRPKRTPSPLLTGPNNNRRARIVSEVVEDARELYRGWAE